MFFVMGCSSLVRIQMFSLIILVFVCSFSYCSSLSSSSEFGSTNVDNNDENGENNDYFRLPSYPWENDQTNSNEHDVAAKTRLLALLLQSALNQQEIRQHRPHFYNRRYAPQAFHAMRG